MLELKCDDNLEVSLLEIRYLEWSLSDMSGYSEKTSYTKQEEDLHQNSDHARILI